MRLFRPMWSDIRYALRLFVKSPGYTILAVLSLGLGIGANTAIFTLMNGLLLRALPVRAPEQLVLLGEGRGMGIFGGLPGDRPEELFPLSFYKQLREKSEVFSDVLAMHSLPFRVYPRLQGETASGAPAATARIVSGNYFQALGVQPALGRVLSDADDKVPGGHPVAVISNGFWKRRLGGRKTAVGQTLTVGKTVYTIIGIAPPQFSGTTVEEATDLWVPLMMDAQLIPGLPPLEDKRIQPLYVIGRLKPGVSREQATARVRVMLRQYWQDVVGPAASESDRKAVARTTVVLTTAEHGLSQARRQFSTALELLLAVVGAVLLIACANVANMVLARALGRRRELAVRLAVGGTRGRLIRQLMTESMTLALLGAAAGVLIAAWGSQLLLKLVSNGSDTMALNTDPDWRVLVFTLGISLATGVLCGLAPALRFSGMELNSFLSEGKGTTASHGTGRFGRVLFAAQVALCVLLVAEAGVFLRSLQNLHGVNTGFATDQVLNVEIDPGAAGYKEDQRLVTMLHSVEERLNRVPGVQAAAFSLFNFNQGTWSGLIWPMGVTPTRENGKPSNFNPVTDGYFDSMGIRMVAGRGFNEKDTEKSPKVAILNETAATQIFGNESPIGKTFQFTNPKPTVVEVAGVVKDGKYQSLRETPTAVIYFPFAQQVQYPQNLTVRVSSDPKSVIPAIRRAIADVDRDLPIGPVHTMAELVDGSLSTERLISYISAIFGSVALVLACIGLYGLLSYSVQQRTAEIGIRMAMGADRRSVVWLVLRQVLILMAAGVAVGIAALGAVSRLVAGIVYAVSPLDPIAIGGAIAVLAITAALACAIPANRASRLDPIAALRWE